MVHQRKALREECIQGRMRSKYIPFSVNYPLIQSLLVKRPLVVADGVTIAEQSRAEQSRAEQSRSSSSSSRQSL
tara:strand:- start:1271 stop:1492 length:222 start_codon:yes stop_codon:yes gene_type:complete